MQFLIMPLLGFVSVVTLQPYGLTHSMGITLLVVTASPGGSYLNWWCSTFNADLALSVTMTSVSSLMSIVLLPANLFFYTYLAYGRNGKSDKSVVGAVDFKALFTTLGIVLIFVISGLSAGYVWKDRKFRICAN